MKLNMVIVILGLLCVSGCVSVGDALSPSASIIRDDNGSKVAVWQPPVGSYSSPSDDQHGLGFWWSRTNPDVVTLEATVCSLAGAVKNDCGSSFVNDVSFDADGQSISTLAETKTTGAAQKFRISRGDFVRIASAKKVLMKVHRRGEQTISTFGTEFPGALVNNRFPPFLAMIQEIQGDSKGK
jgi:hypothetical protein